MIQTRILQAILFLCALNLQSQILEDLQRKHLDTIIEEYVNGFDPGIAVGIVENNQVTYEKYTGYSNLENKTKIDQSTRFNIASNAKQFTALCILKLIEEDKIKLNDDVRKYLPEFYKNINEKITISNLLNHSSGIRDVYDLWSLKGQTWWKLFIGNSDAINLIKSQTDLNFTPGEQFLYSNSNYLLLAEIIEVVSGKAFEDFAQQIFTTLKMNNTSFLSNYMEIIPNKARPYGNWNGWKEYPSISEIHGDGGLFSTLKDQLNWEKIVHSNDGMILSKDLITQSQNIIKDSNIKEYGYGLMFGDYKSIPYSYHDGNTGAYNATFLRFPAKNVSIVVISNNSNVPTNYLAKQLTDIVFNLDDVVSEYPSGPKNVEELVNLQDITGSYETDGETIIKIIEKDSALYREIYQRDPVKLVNEKGGLFHYENNEALKINFSKNKNGQQIFTIYLSSQEPNVGLRVPGFIIDESYMAALNGRYYNQETDTEIVIEYKGNTTFSIERNGRSRDGEMILKDYLRINSYEININRDEKGAIIGLLVDNERIKNVVFNKTLDR